MAEGTVVILGASKDRAKHSNKAVRAYAAMDWTVYPVNPKESEIEGHKCYNSIFDVPKPITRVSIYLPPAVGINVIADIARVKPSEVFFNPGSDSPDLIDKAVALGLTPIRACSITEIGVLPREIASQ